MDTLLQNVTFREDGTLDLNELMRRLVEGFVNDLMDIQVDELFGGVTPRNGYRERTLNTMVGPITLRIPKLREGTCFPSDVIRPYSRTDRALIGAIAEMYVNGVSTRKVEKVAAEMGFESLSSSQVSRMCATLDEEVAGLRSVRFSGMRFPHLWLDATYMKCRENGHVASRAVVTAIAAGEDGSRQLVGLGVVPWHRPVGLHDSTFELSRYRMDNLLVSKLLDAMHNLNRGCRIGLLRPKQIFIYRWVLDYYATPACYQMLSMLASWGYQR